MELDPKYCDVMVGKQAKPEGSGGFFPTKKENAA
jgi:hypothetical protein